MLRRDMLCSTVYRSREMNVRLRVNSRGAAENPRIYYSTLNAKREARFFVVRSLQMAFFAPFLYRTPLTYIESGLTTPHRLT